MQTSPPSSWTMTSNNSSTSNFQSNAPFRKRKVPASELDDKPHPKMFVTEEKMIKEMQTLSLDLSESNKILSTMNSIPNLNTQICTTKEKEDDDDEEIDKSNTNENERTRFELHQLVKDNLKQDDSLLTKLCDLERKKLTLQLVPYMPVHPLQLDNNNGAVINNNNETNKQELEEEKESSVQISDEMKGAENGHVFKKPMVPPLYTVEEPCDDSTKAGRTMKRRYSQSTRYNNNFSVTELKDNVEYPSSDNHPPSPYYIDEPSTPALTQSTYPFESKPSTVTITEFFDQPVLTPAEVDEDMQSVSSSDTGELMDED